MLSWVYRAAVTSATHRWAYLLLPLIYNRSASEIYLLPPCFLPASSVLVSRNTGSNRSVSSLEKHLMKVSRIRFSCLSSSASLDALVINPSKSCSPTTFFLRSGLALTIPSKTVMHSLIISGYFSPLVRFLTIGTVTALFGIRRSFKCFRQPNAYPSNYEAFLVASNTSFQVSRFDSLRTTNRSRRGRNTLKCLATNSPKIGLSRICLLYLAFLSIKTSSCSRPSNPSSRAPSTLCPDARYSRI